MCITVYPTVGYFPQMQFSRIARMGSQPKKIIQDCYMKSTVGFHCGIGRIWHELPDVYISISPVDLLEPLISCRYNFSVSSSELFCCLVDLLRSGKLKVMTLIMCVVILYVRQVTCRNFVQDVTHMNFLTVSIVNF